MTLQWSARDGTIAADTLHYPFGTRFFVPGWGWGAVQDRGGAIKARFRPMNVAASLLFLPGLHLTSFSASRPLRPMACWTNMQGPTRLDLYFATREQATRWGRQDVDVIVQHNK